MPKELLKPEFLEEIIKVPNKNVDDHFFNWRAEYDKSLFAFLALETNSLYYLIDKLAYYLIESGASEIALTIQQGAFYLYKQYDALVTAQNAVATKASTNRMLEAYALSRGIEFSPEQPETDTKVINDLIRNFLLTIFSYHSYLEQVLGVLEDKSTYDQIILALSLWTESELLKLTFDLKVPNHLTVPQFEAWLQQLISDLDFGDSDELSTTSSSAL